MISESDPNETLSQVQDQNTINTESMSSRMTMDPISGGRLRTNTEPMVPLPSKDIINKNDTKEKKFTSNRNDSRNDDWAINNLNTSFKSRANSEPFAVTDLEFNNNNNNTQSYTAVQYATNSGEQSQDDAKKNVDFERLNFNQPETEYIHRLSYQKRKQQRRGMYKWFMCLVIGCTTGFVMFCISIGIDVLQSLSLDRGREGLKSSWWVGVANFVAINLGYSLIAVTLVLLIAPAAGGSGIPEVKAWLNGTALPRFFEMKALLVKCIGLCFSVASALAVGKEGPMVHIGSAIASGVTLGRNKRLGIDSKAGYSFRNDSDARDFISAGAAAGVAAGFSAPIGGMLFALEEVSSFWQPGLTWRAFFAATVSNLVLQLLLGCVHESSCGSFSKKNLIDFGEIAYEDFTSTDLSYFLLIGVVGGMMGMSFNVMNIKALRLRQKYISTKWRKFIEVAFVSLITSITILAVPLLFYCREEPGCTDSICRELYKSGRFTCPDGQYNPIASLLFGKSENIINGLFDPASKALFPIGDVFICFVVYYFLVLLACGIAVPAGLFIPLIMVGALLGHGMGQIYDHFFNSKLNIGVYALLGAAATLGGVTRMTISLTAIMVEITNNISYLMPIMIVVMVSKWVGDRFTRALYDSHVELKHMPYLEPKLPSWVPTYITAQDIMTPTVVTLPAVCSLRVLLKVINDPSHQHSAFPVLQGREVSPTELIKNHNNYTQQSGAFAGMILRWHILILLHHKHFATPGNLMKFARKNILTQAQMTDRTWKYKSHVTLEELNVKEHELDMMHVDLSPYIFLSPITVTPHTPINIIYNIFRGLAMRHLVCLNENEKIAGLITCHELVEPRMKQVVEHVHQWFDSSGNDEMFEQRLRFLKSHDTYLQSSAQKWYNMPNHQNDALHSSFERRSVSRHSIDGIDYHKPLINPKPIGDIN